MIPFAPFEPGRSMFQAAASPNILNAVPTADGWGPLPSLVAFTSALPAPCLGAVYTRSSTGVVTVFAGTATGLYRLNTSDMSWESVSRTTGGAYAVPDGDMWSFCVFGPYLVAVNIANEPQVLDVESGTAFANLGGSPPKARYAWSAGDYLVLGHLSGFPDRVQWSGFNDVTWWTVGEKGSDYQTFPDGGEVQGGLNDRLGAIIIQRNAIRAMSFDPASSYIFSFQSINPARGAVAPRSIVQVGPQDFLFLAEDGFYRGAAANPIGAERIDRWFLGGELDMADIALVQGVADPYAKIVWWSYRSALGQRRLLGYNWQIDRWCASDMATTTLVPILSPGTTWDGLAALYANIDAVNVPFDSRLFLGGRPVFAGFDMSNRLASVTGAPLAAALETADIEHNPGGRAFVNGVRFVCDAASSTIDTGVKATHADALDWKGPTSPAVSTGLAPARANGRLHRYRASIPAGTPWTTAQGVVPTVKASGRR